MDSTNTYSGYCLKLGDVGVIVPFFFPVSQSQTFEKDIFKSTAWPDSESEQ